MLCFTAKGAKGAEEMLDIIYLFSALLAISAVIKQYRQRALQKSLCQRATPKKGAGPEASHRYLEASMTDKLREIGRLVARRSAALHKKCRLATN